MIWYSVSPFKKLCLCYLIYGYSSLSFNFMVAVHYFFLSRSILLRIGIYMYYEKKLREFL